jgi:hypothetical protein
MGSVLAQIAIIERLSAGPSFTPVPPFGFFRAFRSFTLTFALFVLLFLAGIFSFLRGLLPFFVYNAFRITVARKIASEIVCPAFLIADEVARTVKRYLLESSMTKPAPTALFAPATPDAAQKYTVEQSAPWLEMEARFAPLYWERYEQIKPER